MGLLTSGRDHAGSSFPEGSLRRIFAVAAFSLLATTGLTAQTSDSPATPSAAGSTTDPAADSPAPTEQAPPRILFLEDYRRAQEEAAANGESATSSPSGLTLEATPTEHLSRNVFLIPENPRGGILSEDEIDASLDQWDQVLVGLTYESFPTLREMELGYRHPGWPTAVTRERMTHVVDDPDEENPALPDSVISWGYRLAPYIIDQNDRWQTATPLTWDLVEGPQGRLLRNGDHLAEVERAMAGSLASVGHTEDAESLALRAFLARARAHSIDGPLAQRSVRQLIWIYHDWDRGEEKFYRALLNLE